MGGVHLMGNFTEPRVTPAGTRGGGYRVNSYSCIISIDDFVWGNLRRWSNEAVAIVSPYWMFCG